MRRLNRSKKCFLVFSCFSPKLIFLLDGLRFISDHVRFKNNNAHYFIKRELSTQYFYLQKLSMKIKFTEQEIHNIRDIIEEYRTVPD